jgi:hypothetical protein
MERISPITGNPVRKYTRKSVPVEIAEVVEKKVQVEKKEEYDGILKKEDFIFYKDVSSISDYDFKMAVIKRSTYSSSTLYFSYGPTVNCQMMTVGAFGPFLQVETKILEQLKAIKDNFKKNILLVDIRHEYMKYFNGKIPKDMIIMISPYVSTNGSKMNICLINMTKL